MAVVLLELFFFKFPNEGLSCYASSGPQTDNNHPRWPIKDQLGECRHLWTGWWAEGKVAGGEERRTGN